jgi:hypothetical protein
MKQPAKKITQPKKKEIIEKEVITEESIQFQLEGNLSSGIDKVLDGEKYDFISPFHKKALIQQHRGKILCQSEWDALLSFDLAKRT